MTAPVIGLTTYGRHENDFRTTHYSEWFAIPTLYVDAVRRAGGAPILLPPGEDKWEAILENVDGIILIGGGDIDPDNYGGDRNHPRLIRIDPERDASELALVELLVKRKSLPALCICRGMQVANVALGGTLHEHVADVVEKDIHRGPDKGWTVQRLHADHDSRVAAVMGETDVATYSGHHQALKSVAEGLRVTATAEDGIIEAIELPAHPWFICVQWHPEMSAAEDASQQRLFDALVEAAAKNKTAENSVLRS
jgi:putative glutamine amidotransferase